MRIRGSQAFTMLEIMVVIFIIGVIMAAIGPNIAKWWRQAGETQVSLSMQNIKSALNDYRMEFGAFPSTKDSLRALITNPRPNEDRFRKAEREGKFPFVAKGEEGIVDSTGVEFIYHCPPERFKDKYRFYEILWVGKGTEDDPSKDDGA
jgi:general secretion pathway protein G